MTTKAEREWMAAVSEIGCIVCLLQGRGYVPCAIHHLLTDGGRRIGHLSTIGLCDPGHHKGAPADSGEVSRHPNKARFEAKYGSEEYLLDETRKRVEARRTLKVA